MCIYIYMHTYMYTNLKLQRGPLYDLRFVLYWGLLEAMEERICPASVVEVHADATALAGLAQGAQLGLGLQSLKPIPRGTSIESLMLRN